MKAIGSRVFADVLAARDTTIRFVTLGRLVLIWESPKPRPNRKPGAR